MRASELPGKDDQSPKWICGSCHNVWFDQELAESCCAPWKCQKCSGNTAPGRTLCIGCADHERVAHEESLFRSADKKFYVDYDELFLYWHPPGEDVGGLFRSKTEIDKFCEKKNMTPPRWCWATEPVGFLLDAEQVLAGVVTRNNEEVRPLLSDEQVEHFQNLLDEWAMNLDVKSYDVDYERAIILDRGLFDALEAAHKKTSPL